jgi:hypothetical protein
MEFVVGKNKKTYNLDYLTNVLGDIKYNKYEIEELFKMSSEKLNKILKEERNIIPVSRWKKDEKIVAILFGHSGKCNHIMTNDDGDFVGLCKKNPSSDDKSNSNGRCDLMGGKKKSTSKRKTGGATSQAMKGNANSLVTGVYYTGKAKIPPEQYKIYLQILKRFNIDEEFNEKHPFIQNMIIRLSFLESQVQFITERVGIEYINPEEYEKEYDKFEKVDKDIKDYVEVNEKMIPTNYEQKTNVKSKSINKKHMKWDQYTKTVEITNKMALEIDNVIRKARKDNEQGNGKGNIVNIGAISVSVNGQQSKNSVDDAFQLDEQFIVDEGDKDV